MTDPFRVPRPTDDEQAFALKRSAAAARPSKWLGAGDVLVGFGILASLAGVVAGVVAAFLHYPADCDSGGVVSVGSDGNCYTHAYAAVGVGIIAVSVALLLVVIMVGMALRTMPALVVATGAHQYREGTKFAATSPNDTED